MALYQEGQLELNNVYAQMLAERKLKLDEAAVTSSNSIHSETEEFIKELTGDEINLNPEELEEKLRDLEKLELTSLDKKVIAAIRKNVGAMQKAKEDFEKFTKGLSYEFVVSKKLGAKTSEDELKSADSEFESEPAKDESGVAPDEDDGGPSAIPSDI